MILSAAIQAEAKKVMRDGVEKFSDPVDKAAIMRICGLLADEANARAATRWAPWADVYAHIVAGLKACDAAFGWQTARLRDGETDQQRQVREDAVYGMAASIYLLGTQGVHVGW